MVKLKDDRGFTLMETLVVVVIISILVGIVVMTATVTIDRAKSTTCRANLRIIRPAISVFRAANNRSPINLDELVSSGTMRGSTGLSCPSSGDSYSYNQTIGELRCLTTGHEDY